MKQVGSKLLAITLAPLQDLIPTLVAKIIAIDHHATKVGIKSCRGARVMTNNLLPTCFIIFVAILTPFLLFFILVIHCMYRPVGLHQFRYLYWYRPHNIEIKKQYIYIYIVV